MTSTATATATATMAGKAPCGAGPLYAAGGSTLLLARSTQIPRSSVFRYVHTDGLPVSPRYGACGSGSDGDEDYSVGGARAGVGRLARPV